jgi:c-di-GMP-binding flagellar brake protein YcgR
MGIESRRQPRRAVPGIVDVIDTITEDVVGHLGNLSSGGMLLIANRNLPEDALFQLRFSLPDEFSPAHAITTGAHVLWQARGHAPGQYWVGMRFLGLSRDAAHRLRLWTTQPAT